MFKTFEFIIWNLFRISDFEFRISLRGARGVVGERFIFSEAIL
jgi:hypothetical protein